ncbi:MAG: hypothetical protein HY673_12405 [Chloroflexi bacterium]|nr:hypothetical protein [Chloroflexota bacterium]
MGKRGKDFVEVYGGNERIAHIMRRHLESEGIPAVVVPIKDGAVSTFSGSLNLSVLVPRKYALVARKIIGLYSVGKD